LLESLVLCLHGLIMSLQALWLACRLFLYCLVADQLDKAELNITSPVVGGSAAWDMCLGVMFPSNGRLCDISVMPRF
jgi:hypothetical protein